MSRPLFDPATDYYGVLGVAASASDMEIRVAYRRLAKQHHPDLHAGSSRASGRMARLNVAKSVLLDPALRVQYDAARRMRFESRGGGYAVERRSTASSAGVRAGVPSARAAPAAPAAVGSPPFTRHTVRRKSPDVPTLFMLALVAPLVLGLGWYLYGGIQAATQPRRGPQFDLALSPGNRQTAENTAVLAFALVSGRGPDVRTARYVYDVVQSLRDISPEATELRAVSRRLLRSAQDNDRAAWSEAVQGICALAGTC